MKRICIAVIIMITTSIMAQTDLEKPNQFYFSFGAGVSVPNGLTNNFYHDGSTNVQIGFSYEYSFNPRFSWMNGIEIEQNIYNLDLWMEKDKQLEVKEPIDQAKYTRITQRNITAHAQLRFYLSDNSAKNDAAMFFQGGLRASLSGPTNFSYRMNNEREQIDLGGFKNAVYFSAELMVGFKNDFFENFDLLNASTLGFIYQLNPLFINTNHEVFPMHFTWRFLF